MAVVINYNGSNPFSGISETPIVARSVQSLFNAGSQGKLETFTLDGRIRVGPCESSQFESLYTKQQTLLSRFSQNFKSFSIVDGAVTVYSASEVIVRSIQFAESNYYNLLPFTIVIDVYSDSFASQGVLDPVEEFQFSNSDGCAGEIVHTISARGINTSSQAIENVKNFVTARTGWSNQVTPTFINLNSALLASTEERLNRLTGEYSVTERFIFDTSSDTPVTTGLLEYSMATSQDDSGAVTTSISGTITGGINTQVATLRADLVAVNWYNIANTEYHTYDATSDLATSPITFSISENANVLQFQFTYSNQAYSGPYIIDSTTISRNLEENESCIRFRATIRSDYGCPSKRWEEVEAYYQSISIEALARTKWAQYGDGSRLGLFPRSRSYSQNEQLGIITAEIVFCNAKGETCGCLDELNYKLQFTPAIPIYSARPSLEGLGCYYIQDLGYKRRATFTVSGEAHVSNCCTINQGISELKTKLNQLCALYFTVDADDKVLLAFDVTQDDNARTLQFTCSWGGHQENSPIPDSLFT